MSNFHGRFIWYELMTPDIAGAKSFYGNVVGWTSQDMPMPGGAYTILEADGAGVGGAMPLTDEVKAMGVPPNWTAYVAVDDVDAAARKAASLGGSVIRPPQDIPEVGRFAIIADPHGAVIAIMTPVPADPPRPEAARGTLGHASWHELYAGDLEADFPFYAEMFGWKKDSDMDMGPMGVYRLFSNAYDQGGGMMAKPANMPVPAWLYYFQVGDIDQAAQRITAAGGQVLNGPMEVPNGEWIAQGQDPQGAMFAVVGKKAA
ncbi:VOC family protein [Phenylobacterium hankyongense]|uniref:VOC family protein n=1 Tax=Phenylobacterium hankyongense TaxID=1813876 RepID=A0A328AUD0_9CAUL|nr:VOC family protein [Phenylobacterium hankyongense]RAK58643.1 VOC family protein [Phenylobacterium hankyongense]